MDITHDNVCSSMLSCFYSHLLSTGRPISSFSIKSKRANDVDLSFLKPYCELLRMFDFSINSVSLLSNNFQVFLRTAVIRILVCN